MPRPRETAWFAAKPPGVGWGWGLLLRWQGWAALIGFCVLLLAAPLAVGPLLDGLEEPVQTGLFVALYLPFSVVLSAGFIWLCWTFGERPR